MLWHHCPANGGPLSSLFFAGAMQCPAAAEFCAFVGVSGAKHFEQVQYSMTPSYGVLAAPVCMGAISELFIVYTPRRTQSTPWCFGGPSAQPMFSSHAALCPAGRHRHLRRVCIAAVLAPAAVHTVQSRTRMQRICRSTPLRLTLKRQMMQLTLAAHILQSSAGICTNTVTPTHPITRPCMAM
jgi:hypothetical protein